MSYAALPPAASWRHEGSRTGFEVTFFSYVADALHVEGASTGTEDGESWIVSYVIRVDSSWRTRSARITRRSGGSTVATVIVADGRGGWQVDGIVQPGLQGCLDLDLEASAMTNMLPIHRFGLSDGQGASAPAVYVPTAGLAVHRLDQTYSCIDERHYDYAAPAFDFQCRLVYDEHGLILDYPGIATRVS